MEEYGKLLRYCQVAHVFENKGIPEDHALKLSIVFGTAKKALEYIDKRSIRTFT